MKRKITMEQLQQQFVCTTTNEPDEDWYEEEPTEAPCPCCGYPLVVEYGMLVCYRCGWSEDYNDTNI